MVTRKKSALPWLAEPVVWQQLLSAAKAVQAAANQDKSNVPGGYLIPPRVIGQLDVAIADALAVVGSTSQHLLPRCP